MLLTAAARAEHTEARVVWYRASSECPQGQDFLGKLAERASLARLAGAGDHIEASDGETVGRLERQTQGGTVAIRELRDASCPCVGIKANELQIPSILRAGSSAAEQCARHGRRTRGEVMK